MSVNKKIPDLYLEQYVQGELDDSKAAEIGEILKHDAELKERIKLIKESNDKFISEKYHVLTKTKINSRVMSKLINFEKKVGTPWQYASVGAVIIMAVLIVLPNTKSTFKDDVENLISEESSGIRLKGIMPELHIYRKQKDYVEIISNNQLVKENDLLQIRYQGAGYQYGIIFSIDGNGEITLHFPNTSQDSNKIQPQGDITLPFAYQLDDAPQFERFFLVASHKKFNIDEILEQSKRIEKNKFMNEEILLKLPNDLYQTSILLSKVK